MVTSAIWNSLPRRSILVRLLNQYLLIGASVMHPRVDQHTEDKYSKCNREPDRNQ
jgi:hypothetical protein